MNGDVASNRTSPAQYVSPVFVRLHYCREEIAFTSLPKTEHFCGTLFAVNGAKKIHSKIIGLEVSI
jgi:hypothetical protein